MKKLVKILVVAVFIIVILLIVAALFTRWLQDYSVDMVEDAVIPKPVNELPDVIPDSTGWPQWRGLTDNNHSAFTNIITDWSNGLELMWHVDYLCKGDKSVTWSCPAVSGNHLVVPGRHDSTDIIFCLNPQNGDLLWTRIFDAPVNNPSYGEGPRATPTIDDDRVYVLSRGGVLQCLNLYDGKVRWSRNFIDMGGEEPKWGYAASPIVFGSTLIVHVGGEALIVGLDKLSGETLWRSTPGPASYSTPIIINHHNEPILLVVGGQNFYAMDPFSGSTHWILEWSVQNNINVCSPLYSAKHNIALMSAWYTKGTQAVRMSKTRPEVLWHTENLQAHQTDPVILGDYIYGYSGMSAHNRNDFKCLDLLTGKAQWSTPELGTGQFIVIDPYFVSVDVKGNLYLVHATPDEVRIVSKIEGLIETDNARMWTKPVAAQGNLYVRYANRLYCYRLVK